MIEPVTKQIEEDSYLYRPMTATPALKLFTKLTKTIGPAFAALSGAAKDPAAALSLAAKSLSDNLGEEDIAQIVKTFAAQSELNGKALLPQFEIHFMKMSKVFSFLSFAIEAQFGNFSDVFPKNLFAAVGKTETAASPEAST